MAKVSIVMPMYNQEKYIVECLNSVISQTLKDIEIIVVNDGSTDNSLALVKRYAEKDPRIIIIDKPNTGYGHSMNVGFARATGEYIGIVETDDYVELNMFGDLYDAAKAYGDVDIVKSDFCRFSSELGYLTKNIVKLSKNKNYYRRVINPQEEKEVFRFPMNTWTGIYRKEFIEKYNIRHNETPGASYQDNGFWFQTFSFASKIVFLDHVYYMNRRDNPNSSVYNPEKVFCVCDEYEYINKLLDDRPNIKENIKGYYWLKKYHNYIFTLNRIAYMYKREFALRMQKEFIEGSDSGQIEWELFTKKERSDIEVLKNDVDMYLDRLDIASLNEPKLTVIVIKTNDLFIKTFGSIVNQSYGKIQIICIASEFTEEEKEFIRKDKRAEIFESKETLPDSVNVSIGHARGTFIHIVSSGTILNQSLYATAEKRMRDPSITTYICGSTLRLTDDSARNDTVNFKEELLNTGVSSVLGNKLLLYACGVSTANKIFRTDAIRSKTIRLISFDENADSPAFVLGVFSNYDKMFVDKTRLIERKHANVKPDVETLLNEYYVVRKNYKTGKSLNSFVNLFASQVYHWLGEGLSARKKLFKSAEKIRAVLGLEKHTRGYFYNGYVYDLLLSTFYSATAETIVLSKALDVYFSNIKEYSTFNETLLEESANMSRSAIQLINNQVKALTEERDEYKEYYNDMKNSVSFRVGRAMTYIPRKLRDVFFGSKITNVPRTSGAYEAKLQKTDKNGAKLIVKNGYPLVSIVMPLYNVSAYIKKCLDSLLKQTYDRIEIICVDDGSDDDTCEIVSKYAEKYENISLYKQQHLFAGVARNTGFEHVKGKYTVFLDSDDYFEPDFIRSLLVRAEGARADITVCRCRGFDNSTNVNIDMKWSVHDQYLPRKCVFSGRDLGEYVFLAFMGWAWDKMYSTDFIRKQNLRFQDIRSSNDAYFTFTSLIKARRISFVDKILIDQRRNIKTSISQTRSKSWNNCLLAADKIYNDWNSMGVYDKKQERAFLNWYVQFINWHYTTLDEESQRKLAEALGEYVDKYKILDREKGFYYMDKDYDKFVRVVNKGDLHDKSIV